MVTMREAKQRLALNGMSFRKTEYGDFRVAFAEVRDNEASAYYTDDIEDAVLTGAAMRRRLQSAA